MYDSKHIASREEKNQKKGEVALCQLNGKGQNIHLVQSVERNYTVV